MADGAQPVRQPRRPTEGQLALLRSLPDNDKIKWTKARWSLPVEHYLDPERYAREQARIFQRAPVPVAPSGFLPEPNSFACRTVYGKEVVFTRDGEGKVNALVNVCMHRGSRIVTDAATSKGKLLSCPFHAWGYDLNGKLVAVPREETFAELDKSELNLARLPCRELGGIIWVKMDPEADDDFSSIPAELTDDLDALGVPTMHLFATGVHEVEANWKLVMDTFQEGYHVTRLHAQSLKGRFEDMVPAVQQLGRHMRRCGGRAGFVASAVEGREDSFDELRKLVTFHYTLFPNAVMICSQIYVSLLVMMPTGLKTTRVVNFMLTDHPPETEKDLDRFTRSHELTDVVTFPEDFAAAAYSQAGLESGVIKHMTLSSMERYVWRFHQIIDEALLAGTD